MSKYAFTFMEDVCNSNGVNSDPTELLEKMKLRGKVEDFDSAVATVRAECQTTIDNLTAQLNAIKEQELTEDEIVLLNAYRGCKKFTGDKYQTRIDSLEKQLTENSEEMQKRLSLIAEILNQ